MFTTDQGLAMQGTLSHTTAQRNNLWNSSNLISTGTDDTFKTVCAPVADFYTGSKMTCNGSSIVFHDISTNGLVANRTWTFQDGTPATSSEKDPEVTFNSSGWKTITLDVSNSVGSNSLTRTSYVYVSDNAALHGIGFWEGFEDPNVFTNEWIVFNPEGNSSKFSSVTSTGYMSSSCSKLYNYNNLPGDIDQLVSPSYDLTGGGTVYLNFRYSCASHTSLSSQVNDILRVYSSTDCGKTWLLRATIGGSALANVGNVSSSFAPTSSSQWVGKSVLIPGFVCQPNVRFKFEYKTNGYGNNFYIDDINVSNYPVGIDDPDASSFSLNIFPNPVADHSVVILNQQISENISVKIYDLQGRIITELHNGWLNEGEHQFSLDRKTLGQQSMYLLVVDDGINIQREKFVVE
jgi:PKD repeat protein